jgi:hypothetical protein
MRAQNSNGQTGESLTAAKAANRGGLRNHTNTRHGTGRKRPPYGAQIAGILRDPARLAGFVGCTAHRASVWIATGPDAWDWQRAHPRHLVVVLPDGDDPASYSWNFLAGHEPVLVIGPAAADPDSRRRIAAALMRDGCSRVLAGRVLMIAAPAELADPANVTTAAEWLAKHRHRRTAGGGAQ